MKVRAAVLLVASGAPIEAGRILVLVYIHNRYLSCTSGNCYNLSMDGMKMYIPHVLFSDGVHVQAATRHLSANRVGRLNNDDDAWAVLTSRASVRPAGIC